jgi:hypothetical protein
MKYIMMSLWSVVNFFCCLFFVGALVEGFSLISGSVSIDPISSSGVLLGLGQLFLSLLIFILIVLINFEYSRLLKID